MRRACGLGGSRAIADLQTRDAAFARRRMPRSVGEDDTALTPDRAEVLSRGTHRSRPRINFSPLSTALNVCALTLPTRRSRRARATALTARGTATLARSTPSCLPTGGLSTEGDRDADIGTTTTSSSAVPERSSSTDTMIAGRLFPGSPARAAPSETSQSSPRRGSIETIAERPLPVALLGADGSALGVLQRRVSLGAQNRVTLESLGKLGDQRRHRQATISRAAGQAVTHRARNSNCRRILRHGAVV